MKRIICVILVALLTLLTFASCGKDDSGKFLDLNFSEYINVGDYKDNTIDVTSNDYLNIIENYKNRLLENGGKTSLDEVVDGTVENGDTVNIDYVGTMNGVAFEGGTASNYDLVIGSNSFIAGFEAGLLGAKKGEKKKLELTFPTPYQNSPDLAGKPVTFAVTVNKISRTTYPELTEDIAKDLGYDTLTAMKSEIMNYGVFACLMDKIMDSSTVAKTPDKLVDYIVDSYMKTYEYYAAQNNVSVDAYLTQYYGYTEEQFRAMLKEDESVAYNVKEYLVYYYICDAEGLFPEGDDYDKAVEDLAKSYNADVETLKANMSDADIEVNLVASITHDYLFTVNKTTGDR